jgi:rhodanese-related sulfurtransferase/DNA-binding transcriptional ArsR family regulator
MEKRAFKDKVFSELAKISGALSNPRRLEIIDLLSQGEKTVERIAVATGMSVANASQHLQVLKNGSLVEIKRQGNFIFYRLTNTQVAEIWKNLREFGIDRLSEIDKTVAEFRAEKQIFESVTITQLLKKMDVENVILLDVRPLDEYTSGHISTSVCIPIDELADRMNELPKNQAIVAYCRGPFCVFADEAIYLLRENGFRAIRMEEGFPDWKLKGLPVTSDN